MRLNVLIKVQGSDSGGLSVEMTRAVMESDGLHVLLVQLIITISQLFQKTYM